MQQPQVGDHFFMSELRYHSLVSPFGELSLVWDEEAGQVLLRHVLLPRAGLDAAGLVHAVYGELPQGSNAALDTLAGRLEAFLRGKPVALGLELVHLEDCPPFQRRVLLAEYEVPRGCVTTYGALACQVGAPQAARAVGTALARNPFALLIPCHRAVRSDGTLGGYQGGVAMKRRLLEMEGVPFLADGRVDLSRCAWLRRIDSP